MFWEVAQRLGSAPWACPDRALLSFAPREHFLVSGTGSVLQEADALGNSDNVLQQGRSFWLCHFFVLEVFRISFQSYLSFPAPHLLQV